jgi:Fe-S cluster assembly protein SufD
VHVPADVELTAPIGIHVHVSRPGAHLPRVLVVAGHHAKATIYLEHTSAVEGAAPGSVLVDEVVEVFVGPSAMLDLCSLQEWDDEIAHLSLQKASVDSSGSYRPMSVNIGGATVRLRPEVDLVGQGAETTPLGVYFADDGQWFDLQPYIRHLTPRATSDVLFKGALQGASRTVFRGNVLVAENAVGHRHQRDNRSLILTDGARADSTPFLEILCADITAGHGSATGQIDARHLFYLEARGIPREMAIRLIVFGFFREVLDRMDLPGVQERAMEHIEREISLADLDAIGVSDALLPEED